MSHSRGRRRDFLRLAGRSLAGVALAHAMASRRTWSGLSAAEPERPSSLAVTGVETFDLQHRLPAAIGPSTVLYGFRDALLVKISTDSGIVGWGETADVGGTRGVIESHLKPMLLGTNPLEHRALWRRLWGANFGDGRAVAAVDIALQDIRGKALGQSIAEMHGGRLRDKVLAYAAAMNYTEGIRPEDQHPAEAKGLAARGFRAMKLRTGRFGFSRDLHVLAKVREAVGAEVRLLTDGNGAFTLPAAVKFGKELEKLDFYCFEEPLPQGLRYAGYPELTQALDIAVAGGEVLDSRAAARQTIVDRAFDIIQPDATLCGGISEVLFIAEMARLWNIQCIPHCWGSALAIAATLQVLACLPTDTWGFSSDAPMLEFDTYENPFRDQIIIQPFAIDDQGFVSIPTGPGLGVEVREDLVRKFAKK
ncbi:MAG: mandelate racemase/muconate lactonizing enzyme family protein [Planctomycetes bacterium]|nr:mandelate racemase/muconate lactonizing enzyme family protein [Planctomycetota bacterium]